VNVNDRFSMTELQVTVCVFGSTYAFRLIAEGLTVYALCLFCGSFLYDLPFCSYKAFKSSTLFSTTLRIQINGDACMKLIH